MSSGLSPQLPGRIEELLQEGGFPRIEEVELQTFEGAQVAEEAGQQDPAVFAVPGPPDELHIPAEGLELDEQGGSGSLHSHGGRGRVCQRDARRAGAIS